MILSLWVSVDGFTTKRRFLAESAGCRTARLKSFFDLGKNFPNLFNKLEKRRLDMIFRAPYRCNFERQTAWDALIKSNYCQSRMNKVVQAIFLVQKRPTICYVQTNDLVIPVPSFHLQQRNYDKAAPWQKFTKIWCALARRHLAAGGPRPRGINIKKAKMRQR